MNFDHIRTTQPSPGLVTGEVSTAQGSYEAYKGRHDKQNKKLVLAGGLLKNSNIDISWLPAAAETYDISTDPDDYVMVSVPIVTSPLPNRNLQAFPIAEVTYFDPLQGHCVYKGFIGKPVHVDHCFAAGTPVRMGDGSSKPIEEVCVGDSVLTHTGKVKRVTRLIRNGEKTVNLLGAVGTLQDVLVTDNHPIYVVDRRQVFGACVASTGGRSNRYRVKDFRSKDLVPHWRPVSDVYHGDYVCMPIQIGGDLKVDPAFAFILGVFLADGSYAKNKRHPTGYGIILSIGDHELELREKIVNCAAQLGIKACVNETVSPGTTAVHINSVALTERIRSCAGEYSESKRIQGVARSFDVESMKILLGGYISGDGCFDKKKGTFRIRSCSKDLLRDTQQALAFVGIPSCIGIDMKVGNRKKAVSVVKTKYGREVLIQQKHDSGFVRIPKLYMGHMASYVVGKSVVTEKSDKDTVKIIIWNGMILTPIDMVERDVGVSEVYNLEVEEDHTYIAGDMVVHNCNTDPLKAKGVHFDSSLHYIPEYDVYKIRVLLGVDRTKDPYLANQILKGERNGWSMGALVNYFVCSICNATDTNVNPCRHMDMRLGAGKGKLWNVSADRVTTFAEASNIALKDAGVVSADILSASSDYHLIYQECCGVNWIETSNVGDPADPTAFNDDHSIWF